MRAEWMLIGILNGRTLSVNRVIQALVLMRSVEH